MTYEPRPGFGGYPTYGQYPSPGMNSPASAEARLLQLEAELRRITQAPLDFAMVASVDAKRGRMIVSLGPGGLVQVARHPDASVGDQVMVDRATMGIVEVVHDPHPMGIVATAIEIHPGLCEVEISQSRRVLKTTFPVVVGERVIADPSLTYVVGTLGPPKPVHVAPETRVTWEDVGGNEEAKEQLREAVELPFQQPALYRAYGKSPPKGVMLAGPAGCGKTLLAKATATSMARAHGRDHMAAGGFQLLKGPELLNKWLGESEAAIRSLFSAARAFRAQHGYPCVIFLDEADALLGHRDRGMNVSVNATTVPQFLAEMDGFDEPAAVFILATNRPEMLDPAVTREGRVDVKVRVGRPSQRDAAQIVAIHLRGRPIAEGLDREVLATEAAAYLFTPGRLVVREYGPSKLELRHMANGAMLARVVEVATTHAMLRDISAGRVEASGILAADLRVALDRVRLGQRDVDHSSVLFELAETEREFALLASATSVAVTAEEPHHVRMRAEEDDVR